MSRQARLTHYSFTFGAGIPLEGEMDDIRESAAMHLRAARNSSHPVSTLERGQKWEITEPDDCAMIPDTAGILELETYSQHGECRECDSDLEMDGRCELYCPDCDSEIMDNGPEDYLDSPCPTD